MNLIKFIFVLLAGGACLTSCQSAPISSDCAKLVAGDSFYTIVIEVKNFNVTKLSLMDNQTKKKILSRRKLSLNEWILFWASLEDEGIYDWKRQYQASGHSHFTGSNCWGIKILTSNKMFTFNGDDAYPSDSNPKNTTSFKPTGRYKRVFDIFQTYAMPIKK